MLSDLGASAGRQTVGSALYRAMSRRRFLAGLGAAAAAAALGGTSCFVEHAGVKIYYEAQGAGQPLLLHHGWAGSSQSWHRFGYVDALAKNYRLILMDARGHGLSDKPHDEAAYTMQLRTGDVLAVLDAAGVDRAHYWGYSMGGRTGFALLQWHPERVRSFINGGAAPTSPKKYEEQRIRQWVEALRSGDEALIAKGLGVPERWVRAVIGDNDLEALAAAQLGLLSWDGVDPSTLTAPSLHYAGQQDPILPATRWAADAMPNATFKMIPGLNHLTGFARSDLILPPVREFLSGQGAAG